MNHSIHLWDEVVKLGEPRETLQCHWGLEVEKWLSFWDSSATRASGAQGPVNLFPTQVTVSLLKNTFPGCLTTNLSHLKSFNKLFSVSTRQRWYLIFVTENCEWFRNWNGMVAGYRAVEKYGMHVGLWKCCLAWLRLNAMKIQLVLLMALVMICWSS